MEPTLIIILTLLGILGAGGYMVARRAAREYHQTKQQCQHEREELQYKSQAFEQALADKEKTYREKLKQQAAVAKHQYKQKQNQSKQNLRSLEQELHKEGLSSEERLSIISRFAKEQERGTE